MSISYEELNQAFESTRNRCQDVDFRDKWEDVKLLSQHGTRFLRITRRLEDANVVEFCIAQPEDQDDGEDDPEALQLLKSGDSPRHVAIYDIVHSPSYQVPVLYLSVRDLETHQRPTVDEMYTLLVPDTFKPQMEAVGVMGALSLTDHPVSGLPSYFVHPCRTQEVMESLLSINTASPERYLALWIGVIGAGIGLSMPIELARVLEPPLKDLTR